MVISSVIRCLLFAILIVSIGVLTGIKRAEQMNAERETTLASQAQRVEIEVLRAKMADLETALRRKEACSDR